MIRSFIKPANALVSGYSFLRSVLTRKAVIWGMPVALSTELTNLCNLNCPECASGSGLMSRPRGFMDIDLFGKIIDELRPYLLNINLYFQGEPMMHPQFFRFLRLSSGLNSVVSTNGHFLSAENAVKLASSGLRKLIVSLDGIDQETYSSYRINGSVSRVMEGIRNMSDAIQKSASSLKLEIQFLVNRNNERQIKQVKHYARQMHASLKLKSMQIINEGTQESWLPLKGKYSRYERTGNNFIIKSSLPDYCAKLWFNPVVSWDGKVLPCCFDKDADHIMGDLNEDSFRDIWNGPKYRIFRKSIFSDRHFTEICRNCTSGLRGVPS